MGNAKKNEKQAPLSTTFQKLQSIQMEEV